MKKKELLANASISHENIRPDKQKENLLQLSESQIEEKQESSTTTKNHIKKKELLENPSISHQNISTSPRPSKFQEELMETQPLTGLFGACMQNTHKKESQKRKIVQIRRP